MTTGSLTLLRSAVVSSVLLLMSLFSLSPSHVFSACLPTPSCSPPDLAALHSIAAAFPPPLFTAWRNAAARNVCCGHWAALTINCSLCFPSNTVSHHVSGAGRVTELAIDLMADFVDGISPVTFPMALCGLSALTSLRLVGNLRNLISGHIPECTGNNLTHLVHLDLSSNSLKGSIPLSLSGLPSLRYLDLSYNKLSGPIPISPLPSLRYMYLADNMLSGPIPSTLNSFTHLAALDLSDNSLSGSIPSPLNLSHLTSLFLSFNALSGSLPILNTPKLESLDFSSNYISGSLSPLFQASNLTSLLFMYMSGNQLNGAIPKFDPLHFSSLVSHIDLSQNLLSGSLPDWICGLTYLSRLDLSSNGLSGHINTLVTCNFTNLVSLDLSTNLFTGPYPHCLSSNLKFLFLSQNLLSGSLPDWICGLTNLSGLDLSSNGLSGHMNTTFTNLVILDLSTNLFTGPYPHWLSSNLKFLSLSHNNLSGSLPSSWQNLTSLDILDLSGNSILAPSENPADPKLPCWLFALLSKLYLSSMQLQTTDLAAICSAHCATTGRASLHLEVLDLSNNLFDAAILHCLSTISVFHPRSVDEILYGFVGAVPVLNLSGNPLQVDLSKSNVVKSLPKSVATLDLSFCMLKGHLTKLFFERFAPSLVHLHLAHNHLEGQIPGELGNLAQLHTVDLSHNFFTGLSPLTNGGLVAFDLYLSNNSLIGNLSSLLSRIAPNMSLCIDAGYINNLDLSHNFLSGDIPPYLFACLSDHNTRRLKLNHNRLHGSLPNVPFPPHLEALSLSNNQLTGQIPSSFRNLTRLSLLDLSHNKFEGSLENVALFSNASSEPRFHQLRVLLMGSNSFTGTIPTALGDFAPALQLIDLSNNHLTGSIPVHALQSLLAFKINYFPAPGINLDVVGGTLYEEISVHVNGRDETYPYVLQALTALDLSRNELSGSIPMGMGALSGLVYLNLSRNNLSGTIPSDLGAFGGQLQALDMSFNDLVGPIPSSFKNLTGLAIFNVSYNEGLSGPILRTPQFENKDSYIGNPKLCSSSQERVLPNVCSNPFQDGNGTSSSQDEPRKSMNFVERWIHEWVEIRGFLLGIIVSYLGTLWAHIAFKRR